MTQREHQTTAKAKTKKFRFVRSARLHCVFLYVLWSYWLSLTDGAEISHKRSTDTAATNSVTIALNTAKLFSPRVSSEPWFKRSSSNSTFNVNSLTSKPITSNIWRRVKLVASVGQEHNAFQMFKTNFSTSHNIISTLTSTSTLIPILMPIHRSNKQLLRRKDLHIADAPRFSSNLSKAARLEMSTEYFVVPTQTSKNVLMMSTTAIILTQKGERARDVQTPMANNTRLDIPPGAVIGVNSSSVTLPAIISTRHSHSHIYFDGLRKEPWVVPVLVLSILTMLMMSAFEIFVLFKAWRTSPSRRHLFLGQMLLLGLFSCACLGSVITAQPSLVSCGIIRFGVGVAFALVFAALLVKCVFLISLNGGVYLPAPYQALLLLFAVLIQVAIGGQWLLMQPPETYTISFPVIGGDFLSSTVTSQTNYTALLYPTTHTNLDGSPETYTRIAAINTMIIPLCKTQFTDLLFSLIYIVFLIAFIAVLAVKSRGIRDNYCEATYIALAISGAIPIWLGWTVCGLTVAEHHKDACISFGLVATSATVFLIMFMPKGRQLAAMGKEGLYVEDREEQFSSLSHAGSGYSPSFFHFKPIKYGVMGGCGLPNSAINTGNGNSSKHCGNDNTGGAHLCAPPCCYYPHLPQPRVKLASPSVAPLKLPSHLVPPLTLNKQSNSLTIMTQATQLEKALRYGTGIFIRPDETNVYTTLDPTLSSNPNVYFQPSSAVHPGMLY